MSLHTIRKSYLPVVYNFDCYSQAEGLRTVSGNILKSGNILGMVQDRDMSTRVLVGQRYMVY